MGRCHTFHVTIHAKKAQRGTGDTAPLILDLGTPRRRPVSLTHQPLYPQEWDPNTNSMIQHSEHPPRHSDD